MDNPFASISDKRKMINKARLAESKLDKMLRFPFLHMFLHPMILPRHTWTSIIDWTEWKHKFFNDSIGWVRAVQSNEKSMKCIFWTLKCLIYFFWCDVPFFRGSSILKLF